LNKVRKTSKLTQKPDVEFHSCPYLLSLLQFQFSTPQVHGLLQQQPLAILLARYQARRSVHSFSATALCSAASGWYQQQEFSVLRVASLLYPLVPHLELALH
jgi:hypothetical protein